MADLIGQHLGQYEIKALVGEGGMATVYRARQASVKRDVAVKVIESKLARNAEFVRRFEREAQTVASLSHIHILKVFDYGQHGDLVYLVMELLTGGSLSTQIQQGSLAPGQISRIVDQIASALDYAHRRGIVHRDLKPQNVLLDDGGDIHLTDFGIAKILSETTALTQHGVAMGTPAYMAPEQWQDKPLDSRADIYAFGIMLFELLTGQQPFRANTPASLMYKHLQEPPPLVRDFRTDLPPNVENVIQKALAKEREDRFSSAGELAAAFKEALGRQVANVEPVVRSKPAQQTLMEAPLAQPSEVLAAPSSGRGRRLWLAAGGLIGITVLIGIAILLSGRNAQPGATTSTDPASLGPVATARAALPTFTVSFTSTTTMTATLPPTATPESTSRTIPPTPTQSPTQTLFQTPITSTPRSTSTATSDPQIRAMATIVVEASTMPTATTTFTRTPTATVLPTKTNSATVMLKPTMTLTQISSPTYTFTPTSVPTQALVLSSTPTPTATPLPTATVNVAANLRSSPGTASNIVGQAKPGDRVSLVQQVDIGEIWYQVVTSNGTRAWIWAGAIHFDADAKSIPTASPLPAGPTRSSSGAAQGVTFINTSGDITYNIYWKDDAGHSGNLCTLPPGTSCFAQGPSNTIAYFALIPGGQFVKQVSVPGPSSATLP